MKPRIPLPRPLDVHPFTRSQGLGAGLGHGRLEGPDLGRPFYGVRDPRTGQLSVLQRCQAFATLMPPGAFFASVTAAQLMMLPLPHQALRDPGIHVAVPSPARAPRGKGVIGHKVQLMGGDVVHWHGLPMSSPDRVWCELATALRLDDLVAAGDHLIHPEWFLSDLDRLTAATERFPSRRGKPLLREALGLLDERAESAMESKTRLFLMRTNLPRFESNFWIHTPGGRYRLDFACPDYRLYIEYQGEYHFEKDQMRNDMTRRSRLDAIDWRGIEINVRDLDNETELRARIAAMFRLRGWHEDRH